MNIIIRQNNIMVTEIKDSVAKMFLDNLKPHLVKLVKSDTTKADAVYGLTKDMTFNSPILKIFLWVEGTHISVYL